MNLHETVKLKDLRCGSLFKFNETIALRTEYKTESGAYESYIVGSGEMFWGGADNSVDQGNLMVTRVTI